MQGEEPYHWLLSDGIRIEGNSVHNTWQGPTNDGGAGIQINGAMNAIIKGNNVHDTLQPGPNWFFVGVYIFGSAPGNSIVSNVVSYNLIGVVVWVNPDLVEFGGFLPTTPFIHDNLFSNNDYDLWII